MVVATSEHQRDIVEAVPGGSPAVHPLAPEGVAGDVGTLGRDSLGPDQRRVNQPAIADDVKFCGVQARGEAEQRGGRHQQETCYRSDCHGRLACW
ncbi:MAG TPA: hypothetical protein DCE39_00040 [Planctomycetaceae bacterium]|nr:hypothetical protein [Planctomycetaceae bacterium]